MSTVESRLAELGLTVPEVVPPVAAYVPAVRSGNHVWTSGQLPMRDGAMPATVSVVESLGHERNVGCRLADGTLVIARQAIEAPAPRVDGAVRLAAEPGRLHVFDADGGDRIEAT